MDIASFNPAESTPGPSLQTFGDPSLGKDEFLNLLVAQLRNQDPLNPQEGHEFVAQLAQFSSVEQLANISATLDAHSGQLSALAGAYASGSNLSTASAMLGQTVEVASREVAWNGTEATDFGFELGGAAAEVEVTITNADGDVVRTLTLGARDAGSHDLSWDGQNDDGTEVPEGTYTFEVSAETSDGDAVGATRFVRGTVDRITIEQGHVMLWFGERSVRLDDLRSIVAPEPDGESPGGGTLSTP